MNDQLNFLPDNLKKFYKRKNFNFLKNKKILITGATGILGLGLTNFFIETLKSKNKPREITLIFKSKLPKHMNFLKKIKEISILRRDLTISNLPDKKKYDCIIHLAGYGQPAKFMQKPMKTFLLNTAVVEKLLKKMNPKCYFLYLSSSEIYSGLLGNIKEDQIGTTSTDHQRACYIEAKRGGETIVNIYKNLFNINAKIARLCLAYGPGTKIHDERVLNQFIKKGLINNIIKMNDDGSALRSYIYIDDAIEMLLNILFFGKKTIYNIGGKSKISIYNLAKKIGKILSVPVIKFAKKQKKIGAPKEARVSIMRYEKEFGKINLKNLDYGLNKTVEWQKKEIYFKKFI